MSARTPSKKAGKAPGPKGARRWRATPTAKAPRGRSAVGALLHAGEFMGDGGSLVAAREARHCRAAAVQPPRAVRPAPTPPRRRPSHARARAPAPAPPPRARAGPEWERWKSIYTGREIRKVAGGEEQTGVILHRVRPAARAWPAQPRRRGIWYVF